MVGMPLLGLLTWRLCSRDKPHLLHLPHTLSATATAALSRACARAAPLPPSHRPRRQTAASVVQHISLGVAGLGCEPALMHLLNFVWPNVFETSPHVVQAVTGAIDGCRVALGPSIVLHYLLQVRRRGGGAAGAARGCGLRGVAGSLHSAASRAW